MSQLKEQCDKAEITSVDHLLGLLLQIPSPGPQDHLQTIIAVIAKLKQAKPALEQKNRLSL